MHNSVIDAAAAMNLPDENPHYIRRVTEVGDSQEIVANEDIYASNGMKLIAKGALINSAMLARLTSHKLSASLDRLLVARIPVDATCILHDADKLVESDPRYRQIMARTGDALAFKHALGDLRLPDAILLRMTVMRERFGSMYDHSVRCAILAFAMAQRLKLPLGERSALLLAALCHDMGEMHTDPALLDGAHDITPDERRFVHVHPVTAFVLVRDLPDFPAAAAQAILHHHERLDGSGYPSNLPRARIGRLAQLLAVADVAEAVLTRFSLARLDMLFRLNMARFDLAAVGALRDLASMSRPAAAGETGIDGAAEQMARLASLLQAWTNLRASLDTPAARDKASFLFDRMNAIRSLVLQAGFDPDHMDAILAIVDEDPAIVPELRGMLDEMDWLLDDLANEIERRSPELAGLSEGVLESLVTKLRSAPRQR